MKRKFWTFFLINFPACENNFFPPTEAGNSTELSEILYIYLFIYLFKKKHSFSASTASCSLIFLRCISGVSSQVKITESGGGQKRPGETLRLNCTVSGFSLATYVHWIRQSPGKGLEWAGAIWGDGNTGYNSALRGRISITRDTSRNQVFLQLTGLKAEDSAMYYCTGDTVRKLYFFFLLVS
uniref:Ig-like domain-containing protein n=1 Tax=Salvator merianae TaxID=96440 RepID=A0A8D0BCF6_SALMN